jgi:hypothetical protein
VILGQFDGPGNAARRAAFPSTFPAMTREVPGIHVTPAKAGSSFSIARTARLDSGLRRNDEVAWMPGTRPGMTQD